MEQLRDNMKKVLPKVIGKVFRDISGKGPERVYVDVISNIVVVYVTGYITSGLVNSKLFEDSDMRRASETYYNKLAHNSLEVVSETVKENFGFTISSVMSDFIVKENTGIVMYVADRILAADDICDNINGSYHNFIRNKISEFMIDSTGAYPRSIDLYLVQGDLYIFISGFLGFFNETKYRFNTELIEANRAFYYGVLKGEFSQNVELFSIDDYVFQSAFCDVDVMTDRAMIVLKGVR
ncbi:MAG: Na-translocating system protein MpsC family protein [Lachnospiraceae bacterium]|nr:Na-translocating system protein MpsC family protein [Lachnospiraceae bacterium]